VIIAVLLFPSFAHAVTLDLRDSETVAAGVVVETWRASSPSTDVYVARVDLCTSGVYVESTRATTSTTSTGSWAAEAGVTLATNGDFYKTGPLRVYGDAVGGGVAWPIDQTGRDDAYEDEWYYEHYGWIAFLHDGVEWTHTGWVKENASAFGGALGGWEPTNMLPEPPPGTLALVSGFPELVVEGTVVTCSSPTAEDCFEDRSDMRDRHPRTAMGITEDLGTLLLVVVDGRTSDNTGVYGTELASIMGQFGAWQAFNLDGGGSSQLWTDAADYVNDVDGNNSGGGARGVANHLGVYAGSLDFLADRPGHCATATPCATLPSEGGTIDDDSACFRGFGDQDYWRTEAAGTGGSLQWTNAFTSDYPDNWAWWQVDLQQAGSYRVEVWTDATWSVHSAVRYVVHAAGTDSEIVLDPSDSDGWLELGTWSFAAGGEQPAHHCRRRPAGPPRSRSRP